MQDVCRFVQAIAHHERIRGNWTRYVCRIPDYKLIFPLHLKDFELSKITTNNFNIPKKLNFIETRASKSEQFLYVVLKFQLQEPWRNARAGAEACLQQQLVV